MMSKLSQGVGERGGPPPSPWPSPPSGFGPRSPASRPPPGKRPPACWAATGARPPTGAGARPPRWRADGLAAILAAAARPRTDGRGVESHTTAHRRGRLDAVIASLLFMGGLRRSEVSALEWRDVSDARDGDGVLLTVRTSKTNQEGDAADVSYLKNGSAKAIRALRTDRPDAAPTDRVVGLSPLQIQRRFTAAARAAGIEARVTAHSGRVGLASELTARGASTTEVMLAGNWKTARMVAHYSAGATAERGAVARICKGGDGGTPRQHYGITRASLRDEFPLGGDRCPHRRTTAKPHQNHITQENFMGGISAIFGLGSRQQEKVTAAAFGALPERGRGRQEHPAATRIRHCPTCRHGSKTTDIHHNE